MKSTNEKRTFKSRLRAILGLAMVSAALAPLALLIGAGCASEDTSKTAKPVEQMAAADSSKEKPKNASRKLSGAELYSMNCNRCHQERYPTERTAAQWRTILLHMEVRANLPAGQARTILQYLQDNSGR
jgi:hypothetical protein